MVKTKLNEPDGSSAKSSPVGRFVYTSGSRPLDGYTIKRGIGHGGFGEVYYATSDAGKEVALKLIRRNLDIELRGVKQCLNLKHPDLLSIFDIREDERGDNWVVMEYVAGQCLAEAIDDNPNGMPTDQVLAWLYGMGAGVGYLHDHGIVHRDLKPANIFSDEGLVKIGDYGLSKFISCSRRSGQTESVGTVHYIAPEVANGRYGKEVDVYSLGIMLYEMLTGRVPFEGESVGEVLMKHLTAKPDVSMLAEPYRTVVAKALQKDPVTRYGSISELLAQLPPPPDGSVRLPPGSINARDRHSTPIIDPKPVDDEPIQRAFFKFVQKMNDAWNESQLNTPTKLILLIVGLFMLAATSGVLLPMTVMLLIVYGGYRIVRAIILGNGKRPRPTPNAASTSPFNDAVQVRKRHFWHRNKEESSPALILKTSRERVAELLGSMLGGAITAATMCLVLVMLASFRSTVPDPEKCVWILLVSIAGTWAVMVPTKLWEGAQGEPILRRFVMMAIGLGLGALAYFAADALMINWTYDREFFPQSQSYQFPRTFYADDGSPLLLAHMAVFGSLFLIIRWWHQADPLRTSRLRLGILFICAVFAALVASAWHFPQPWLVMVACTISASIQLASPWTNPRRRCSRNHIH